MEYADTYSGREALEDSQSIFRYLRPSYIFLFLVSRVPSFRIDLTHLRHISVFGSMILLVIAGLFGGYLLRISSDEIRLRAESNLRLISESVASRILEHGSFSRNVSLGGLVLNGESRIFLIDDSGTIISTLDSDKNLVGGSLTNLLNNDHPIFSPTSSGVLDVLVDSESFLVFSRRIMNGFVITMTPHSRLYRSWNLFLNIGLVVFVLAGILLLIFLVIGSTLASRARESSTLLDSTRARFDTALSRGHCGLWDWNLETGAITWSDSMFSILGMESLTDTLEFEQFEKLVHPRDMNLRALAETIFRRDSHSIDQRFRMLHSSGDWIWLRVRAELVRYSRDKAHLIGIVVDISEHEQLKQRNRDAGIRLRDAIDNISESFVLLDSSHRLVMCNSKYSQLYNLPPEATREGITFDDMMARGRRPRIMKRISTDSSSNDSKTVEAELEDGRWLQISERPTHEGGFVSIGTDITQLKRNEKKLRDSENRLKVTLGHQRAAQQEAQLQAQELVELAEKYKKARQRAEAANKTKSEFMANMSHELRTPLNAIIGFSEIMRDEMFGALGDEKYSEYARDIYDSGSFLLGVINDILDMSKIEAGRFALDYERVELNELVDEVIRIIHGQAEQSGIKLEYSISDSLALDADRRATKQILLNLLSNAVKFTPSGGSVSVTAQSTSGNVSIDIRDTGVGISESALKRLGKPFEQVQGQFTKNHTGSGLGLAIARSLAGLHGGSLTIKSKPKEGTLVTVRLPLTKPASTSSSSSSSSSSS